METSGRKPHCIGIIMDGNRRWARAQELPTLEGHRRGYKKMKDFVKWADEAGISHVVAYAFSTENWERSAKEVEYLMGIFDTALDEVVDEAEKRNGRLSVIGQRERLSSSIQEKINSVEEKTKNNTGLHLVLAISYGGRAEIVTAVNKAIENGEKEVSEETFAGYLWSADIPEPDIIMRTSGEKRLSNFLTWGSVYSELYFIDKHWPEFEKSDFKKLLDEYAARERRHGK